MTSAFASRLRRVVVFAPEDEEARIKAREGNLSRMLESRSPGFSEHLDLDVRRQEVHPTRPSSRRRSGVSAATRGTPRHRFARCTSRSRRSTSTRRSRQHAFQSLPRGSCQYASSVGVVFVVLVVLPVTSGAAAISIDWIRYDPPGMDDGSNTSLNQERIRIENTGNNARALRVWTIHDSDHTVFYFPGLRFEGGEGVTIHTGTGDDTRRHLYWGLTTYVGITTAMRPFPTIADCARRIAAAIRAVGPWLPVRGRTPPFAPCLTGEREPRARAYPPPR